MKKALPLFLSIVALLWSFKAQAQCELSISPQMTSPCGNSATGSGGFMVLNVSGTCANATTYSLNWTTDLDAGSPNVPGTLPFIVTVQFSGFSTEFCAEVTAWDSEGNEVGTGNFCQFLPPPVLVTNISTTPAPPCSDEGGCATFQVIGGTAPYTYSLSSTPGTINNPPVTGNEICNLQPGMYNLIVFDAAQCITTASIQIQESEAIGLGGYVFNDLNSNGAQGSGIFAEDGLANQPIVIQETGDVLYTNSNGYFTAPSLPAGTYTLSWAGDAASWQPSLSTYSVESPGCLAIPLSSTTPIFQHLSQLGSGGILHCTNGSESNFWVANTGNTAFNVRLELNYNASLTAVAPPTGLGFTSAFPGQLVWEYEAQMPGTSVGYNAFIEGPGVGLIGQNLTFSYTLVLSDADGNVIFEEEFNQNRLVACAYDPNDKEGLPVGMGDGHYVPAGTVLTYRIRFQNTGNFPAERVEIVDQLDVDQLNLSTFTPLHSSHAMVTELSETGEVRFIFDNIQLPDSTSNEPESHGYVFYSIRINEDAQHNELISNVANIYFDANPPIITNETEHRVYDCAVIPQLTSDYATCEGGFFTIDMTTDEFNSHVWSMNGVPFSESAFTGVSAPEVGLFTIDLSITNEYCEVNSSAQLEVFEIPNATITLVGNQLVASPAGSFQWYYNDLLLENEVGNTLTISGAGVYTVIVTSSSNCVDASEPFFVVSVNENTMQEELLLYPNPFSETAFVELGAELFTLQLFAMDGKKIGHWEKQSGRFELHRGQLSTGMYFLHIEGADGKRMQLPVMLK